MIDDKLIIASGLNWRETVDIVVDKAQFNYEPSPDETDTGEQFFVAGWKDGNIYIQQMDKLSQSLFNEPLGISGNIRIRFEYHKFGDYEAASVAWLSAVQRLIDDTNWDLALLQDYIVVLLRKSGKLSLAENDSYWLPFRLDVIKQPYTFEKLPRL